MTSIEADDNAYIALGTSSFPYFLVRNSLEELMSALTSIDGLVDQGELHPQIEVFDACGAKVEEPFALDRHDWPCEPPLEEKRADFYARCAAVLATLAARAANEVSGPKLTALGPDRHPNPLCYVFPKLCRH